MKLAILIVLIAATFAQKVNHPSCKLAVSKNGRCGPKFGNTRCAGGPKAFCSKWGWCGTSKLHKKTNQVRFMGRICRVLKAKKPVVRKSNLKVACALKVSKNGRCGVKFGRTRCGGKGAFCSKWGWCGTSKLHKKTQQALYNSRVCAKKAKK